MKTVRLLAIAVLLVILVSCSKNDSSIGLIVTYAGGASLPRVDAERDIATKLDPEALLSSQIANQGRIPIVVLQYAPTSRTYTDEGHVKRSVWHHILYRMDPELRGEHEVESVEFGFVFLLLNEEAKTVDRYEEVVLFDPFVLDQTRKIDAHSRSSLTEWSQNPQTVLVYVKKVTFMDGQIWNFSP